MSSQPARPPGPVESVDATEVLDHPGARRPVHIVVVGAGFAGYFATERLVKKLKPEEADITVVSDLDGMLYQPLLPEVAVGTMDPRTIIVPLSRVLGRAHLVRGRATRIDPTRRTVHVDAADGETHEIRYDRLLLTAGSVSRVLDIPGLAEHGIGFKTATEGLYLRDLLLHRMEQANDEPDESTRRSLLSFIVVGAGYAGTELTAQMARLSDRLRRMFPAIGRGELTWMLLDMAPAVMPELGGDLGSQALKVLRKRGVDVRLKTSVDKIAADGAHLTDGTFVPGAAVVWCAGVTPSPIVSTLELPVRKGRLAVDADFTVPTHRSIYGAGDAASVPDVTKPKDEHGNHPPCPPTAQHAMRQGRAVAKNIIADVRGKSRRDYKHHDLGLVVDLGGPSAVARPLGIPLTGLLAKLVTRAYHVYALPSMRRRLRTLSSWALAGGTPDDVTLGMPQRPAGALAQDEHAIGRASD